jgi:hypothetical protein
MPGYGEKDSLLNKVVRLELLSESFVQAACH